MNQLAIEPNLILNLTICFVFVAFVLMAKYYWLKPVTVGPTAVDQWQALAVSDCNDILIEINTTKDNKKLDSLEIAIDVFENHYANLIPLNDVQDMVVRMYDNLKSRKEKLNVVHN